MTDLFPSWLESLATSEQRRVTWLLAAAIVLILLYLFRHSLDYWREGRQIRQAARRLGARLLNEVRLPDGMGSEIGIDFVALAPDAILVIGVRRYDGFIFGSAQTDEWTQTIRNRSYKFPNPDAYLQRQVGAVRIIAPKTPVRGVHLFADSAVFPRDKPSNVLQVKDLRDCRRPAFKDIPADLRTAWIQLAESLQ